LKGIEILYCYQIQDVDESTSDNNQEGSTTSLSMLEGPDKLSQPQDFPMAQLPEVAEMVFN